jgi:hypothetical protein
MAGIAKTHMTNQTKVEITKMQEEGENRRNVATHIASLMKASHGHDSATALLGMKNGTPAGRPS